MSVSAYYGPELDRETLEQAEREALERPSNSAMWDDRLYRTHGPVISWAERGDDPLAESNYYAMLEIVTDAAGDDAGEHVIDATISDWLVGSLRQIFVQTRDDAGNFTPAFIAATEAALALRDYPVLDEGDYSRREWERYERLEDDAMQDAAREYEDDTDEERVEITIRAIEVHADADRDFPDVDWDAATDAYRKARDDYFEERAQPYVTPYTPADVYAKTDDVTPEMF